MKSVSLKAILLCLIPPLIWGGMFPIAGHLEPTVNMFAMTLIRYGLVAVILIAMLLPKEGTRALRTEGQAWKLFLLGSAGFAGFGLLAFTALSYTQPVNVSLIMAMMPAISAVIASAVAKKFPPIYTVIAILIAFAGVALVLTDGNITRLVNPSDALGELLALLGAICWVLYTRGAASVPGWSVLRYTTVTTVLGLPTIAIATVVATTTGFVSPPAVEAVIAGWPELSYLIVFAGVVAVLFWNQGNRLLGPINGTLFMNLVPVTTFTITAIVTQSFPTSSALIGLLLVICGLLVNNICARRAPAASKAEKKAATRALVNAGK